MSFSSFPLGQHVAEDTTSGSYHRAVFDHLPFSSGASRLVYKGKFTHPGYGECVVKEFKASYARYKSDWQLDVKMMETAAELANKFNYVTGTNRPIEYREVIPMKVTKHDDGLFRGLYAREKTGEEHYLYGEYTKWFSNRVNSNMGEWVAAEHYLYGEYTKWLSNNGWVNSNIGESLPAFSHWTWVETNAKVLVCDLQGVQDDPMGYWLTDPAIHSP
jgi:hypothetical protein